MTKNKYKCKFNLKSLKNHLYTQHYKTQVEEM